MTLTVMSLLWASKSGSTLRNASFRLLAAAIVTVSGAACTGAPAQTVVVNTPRNNRLLISLRLRVMAYLLVTVMKFIMRLEIELVLDVDPVFDEIATEARLGLERVPVRCGPAASHCDVGVIDDESIVIGTVEAIVDGGAEFFRYIVFLFRGGIQYPISNGKLELPGNDIFADLHIPAPGVTEMHRGADCQWACWNCGEVERLGSAISAPHLLLPIVPF